jgi:hypothetical protein
LLPPDQKKEVQDFIEWLKSKATNGTSPGNAPSAPQRIFKMQPDFDAPLDDFTEYM